MIVITKKPLIDFSSYELQAKKPIENWYAIVSFCSWSDFYDVKKTFNSVDSVGNDRYVFNIGGNKYRIVAMIHFNTRTLYIRFVGTHKQYDKIINIKTI